MPSVKLNWDKIKKVTGAVRSTADPTVNNYQYPVPTMWINTTTGGTFVLIDSTPGAAVWQQYITSGSSPSFVTVDLTGVTDGNLPYMQPADAGFGDSPLATDGTDVTCSGKFTLGELELNDNDITAVGTGADIDIDLVPKGTGEVNLPKVDIDSGTIDATTIGATTQADGSFTKATVDNLELDGSSLISTNTDGDINLTPNGTGEVNISKVDIDSGTIDGATIATSDITVGAGKTLDVSAGTLTLANDQISGDKVEGGTINAITINTLTSTTVNATTFDTNVEAAAVTLSGTTLAADGTDADIDINLTPKGTGTVVSATFTGDLDGNAGTASVADSLKSTATTGLMTVIGPGAGETREKIIRDANDTILELGGSYTPTGTWTSMTLVTPALGTPASGDLRNCSLAVAPAIGSTTPNTGAFTTLQARRSVPLDKTADYTILEADLGKTVRFNHATTAGIMTLMEGTSALDDARITFFKIGAARLSVKAHTGQFIMDSSAAGTIYSDSDDATITLAYVHATTKWVIVAASGTWTTT